MHEICLEKTPKRNPFYRFSAIARFHTAWSVSDETAPFRAIPLLATSGCTHRRELRRLFPVADTMRLAIHNTDARSDGWSKTVGFRDVPERWGKGDEQVSLRNA